MERSGRKQGELITVEEYQELLKLLKIRLPKGILNSEIIKKTKKFINEGNAIAKKLKSPHTKFRVSPRLGCREIKRALQLKKKGKVEELVELIFLRTLKRPKCTFENWWQNITESGGRFQMTNSFKQMSNPESKIKKDEERGGNVNHEHNQSNEMKCFRFFNDTEGLKTITDWKRERKLEFGFFTGKADFLANYRKSSATSSNTKTSKKEKIIIECKSTENGLLRKQERAEAKLNKNHQYYYQTLSYLYILQQTDPSPDELKAVIVLGDYQEESEKFYYGNVSKDTTEIKNLDRYCRKKVLPTFLAVLNVMFEKVQ